jgi:hypothetical protein
VNPCVTVYKSESLTAQNPSRAATATGAARAVLDVAERLAQTRGYNLFSYADIAAQLGATKASLRLPTIGGTIHLSGGHGRIRTYTRR